jgi:glucuronate isomerase
VQDALSAELDTVAVAALFDRVISEQADGSEWALFRGQMLSEMAKMSVDDGMVMQVHAGSFRNHSAAVFARFGRDKGFDIPKRLDYVSALQPLLNAVGMEPNLMIILYTLDESAYARELAPLAGISVDSGTP